ncbi:phosphotransferase system mannitol/fructose-specifc IIA component (Ntr-type) [Halobacteroides halobius DSM 5150]|uniref:Ascorbate-specific PTS system EIIA component n=1 Tax=Halobacteroides halobius (strain ATCC 35273 / DSM 5150 / MD-1) TaxID=748449 RepID=L0K9H6_HALHC|nr:PTS sugar transporter subunit IIA [Halobacteroides halobius]AGB40758.1 phosphotransferase system mannitol/fructose-specifc IIA component (Ntr-type) [Halobacteroides halobius DSM 5150]
MIKQYLNSKNIKTSVEVNDWEEAVEISGSMLVDNGLVKPSYIESMKDMIKKEGAYVVISPGLAIPHARPEKGVLEPGISLITLKTPVEFGHSKNDPVKVVIAFCASDDSSHVEMMRELVTFLNANKNLQYLKEANNKDKLISYIQNYDKGGQK